MTTDTELDQMYEAAVADDWEEQNKPESERFPEWNAAKMQIKKAGLFLREAVNLLLQGQSMVHGSSEDCRIGSIADEVSFLAGDIEKQLGRMGAK